MAPNTEHKRPESHELVGASDASPLPHLDQSTAGEGTGEGRPSQYTAAHSRQGEGGWYRGRGSYRGSTYRGRGGLGHSGSQRRNLPPAPLVNVVSGLPPPPFFTSNHPQMPMPPPEFNPSLGYALPMMPVGGGAPPPGMMMHGKPIEENGPPLDPQAFHPQPFFPPPPPHYSPLHFPQPFIPHPTAHAPLFVPPLLHQPVPPPHLLHEQPTPTRAPRGRLLFSPPPASAESSAPLKEEPKAVVVQPLARAKNILFTLDSQTGRAMERPKEERGVAQLMVVEPRDRPSSIEPCRPTPSSSPPPTSASTAVAESAPPPSSSTASRHSPSPASPEPEELVDEEMEEDSASEGELGEVDKYLQSVYQIIEQTKPNMAEKAYNDEFLIAMRDLIRKESGWIGVGSISSPQASSLPLSIHSTLPAPRPLPPSAVNVVEKAARPWTNHPVQPLPGAVAPHRPGGPVPGPLDFSRNAMRARKQAKAVERSENAFAPKREVTEPVPVDEKLIKGIRRILNKITPTTYEEMATAFCEKKIHLEPEELLAAVVDFIFEKAVDEPTFCQMYADLCKRQSDEEKSANDNGKFLQAVIRKCQVTFERDVQHIEEGEPASETVVEAAGEGEHGEQTRAREKKRILGTIKLIACLYQHSCIGAIVMAMCANILFHRYRDEHDELYVEYAVEMFQEVGPKFHDETTLFIKRGGSPHGIQRAKDALRQWESAHASIRRAKSDLSPRVRILVTNLEEGIRKAANGPKTIEELDREAKEEAHQQERKRMEFNERRHVGRHGEPRRGGGVNVRLPPQLPAGQRPLINNPARSPPRPCSPVHQHHASPVKSPAEQQLHREEKMRERRMKAGLASTKAGGGGANGGGGVTQRVSLIQTNKSTSVSFGGARPSPFGRRFPPGTKTTEELTSTNWRQRATTGDTGGGVHQVAVEDKAAKEHGK